MKTILLKLFYMLPDAMRDWVYMGYIKIVKKVPINKYSLCSVRDYTTLVNGKYILLNGNQRGQVYLKLQTMREMLEDKNVEKVRTIPLPPCYVAELYNISVRSGCSLLMSEKGGYCLDDVMCMYYDKLYIRSEDVIMSNKNSIWVRHREENQNIEKGIFLLGFASSNYYHFTIEILSRLKYVDDLRQYSDWPLLIDEQVCMVQQYRELIEMINVWKHPLIYIKKGINYNVENLVYPSYNTWLPINLKKHITLDSEHLLISKDAIFNIRGTILEKIKAKMYRKIYISRRNVGFRRLANEDDVERLFEQYGFEIICPEQLSYTEQVKMFQEAEYIAGISGAAMTNLIYCNEGATYITFIDDSTNMYLYPVIAKMINMQCHLLPVYLAQKTGYMSNSGFKVDLNECEKYLKQFHTI